VAFRTSCREARAFIFTVLNINPSPKIKTRQPERKPGFFVAIFEQIRRNMKKYKIKSNYAHMLADTITPVGVYLRLRDIFPNSFLLESSEYHARENAVSYICCKPLASIQLDDSELQIQYPGSAEPAVRKPLANLNLRQEIAEFRARFQVDPELSQVNKVLPNGLFGYFTFEVVEQMEQICLTHKPDSGRNIPRLQYHFLSTSSL